MSAAVDGLVVAAAIKAKLSGGIDMSEFQGMKSVGFEY